MNGKELFERINDPGIEVPKIRDVSAAFAQVMGDLMDRFTPEEQAEIIRLGALVKKRSSRLIPVIEWEDIDAHMERCANSDSFIRGLDQLGGAERKPARGG